MARLDWSKASEPNPDPARVRKEDIPAQLSDRDTEAFKRQVKAKYAAKESKVPRRPLKAVLTAQRYARLKSISDWIKVVEETGKPDADGFIQKVAILAMQHAEATGDCGHLTRLVRALPSKARGERLALWISRFSPVRFGNGKRGMKASLAKRVDGAKVGSFDLERARRARFS